MSALSLTVLNNQPTIAVYAGDITADMAALTTVKAASALVGGLSSPSKMPCPGYSIPASTCKTGGALRSVPGSVCYSCYAADDHSWLQQGKHRGLYAMPNVRNALAKRFASLTDPMWVPAMTLLIKKSKHKYFRWHDSGDLQSVEHLENIAIVARNTPDVQHWLPTREYNVVRAWRQNYAGAPNLVIRASAHMIDKPAPADFPHSSMVLSDPNAAGSAQQCLAWMNDNKCGGCRACWDTRVATVWYHKH